MLLKIFVVLSVVVGAIVAEGESNKRPKPTTTTTTTTPIYYTGTVPPWRTTLPSRPPTPKPGQIAPLCCAGLNEIYLPPRIAPHCQVYCKDIGKPCKINYDIPEPYGCYSAPGYCKDEKGNSIPFSKAFNKCH